ncbi:hypothetical protein FOZ60_000509 [Perkinsus olseni]|uniref:Phospholipid/glycerol acyltransferase domain-containing protein n=1 Tax=Perkinsus olseni TaxID=32597 RepID=A0A7J6P3D5_PEROL|nr:hypothetical protein FOZ60_000509 [Perkinsus olseni]
MPPPPSPSTTQKVSSSDEGSSEEEEYHKPADGRTTNKMLHLTLYQKVDQIVRSLLFVALFAASAPFIFTLLALVYFLPEDSHLKKRTRTYCCVGVGRMAMATTGVQLSVQNREALSKLPSMDDNGVLMLFTHGSNLDGFAVSACFDIFSKKQLPMGVVAKKSLFKIPILGTLFRLTGVVAIDRAKHNQAISQLDSAVAHIDSVYVVGISPEGTRRRTPSWGPDQLKPFKKGPFHMVKQIKSKTFLPATLFGANAAWPPGSLFPIPGAKVTVRFGDPVKVDASKDVAEIQSETREVFKREIVAGMAGKPYSQDTAFSLGTPVPRSLLWGSTLLLFVPLVAFVMSKLVIQHSRFTLQFRTRTGARTIPSVLAEIKPSPPDQDNTCVGSEFSNMRLSTLSGYLILYITLGVFAAVAYLLLVFRSRVMVQSNADAAQDFYAARKRFSWAWIGASYFASGMGTWVIYAAPEVGTFLGWWGVLGYALACVVPMAIIWVLGVKIRRKMNSYMAAGGSEGYAATDWILARFGRLVQAYAVLVSIFLMWISTTAEYTAVGQVIRMFTGIPVWLSTLSVAVITLSYTLVAGLPVSILTDMAQGVAAVGLIVFAVVATSTNVTVTTADWNAVANWSSLGFQSLIALILAILGFQLLDMVIWQRVWAAKNDFNLRMGLLLGGTLIFLTMIAFGVLGMLAEAQDRARPVPHLTLDPYTKSLAFFDLLGVLPNAAVGAVVVLAICLTTSSVDSLQSAFLSVFAAEFVKRGWSLNWGRLLLVLMNVPAIVVAMREISVINLFLVADLVAATICMPAYCGLYSTVTTFGAVCGIIAANLAILIYGWASTGTFVGGFIMYTLPGGLYSSTAMIVFLVVMVGSVVVTLAVSIVQRKLFPRTEGFLAQGRYLPDQPQAEVKGPSKEVGPTDQLSGGSY